jgi:hypothetical protein
MILIIYHDLLEDYSFFSKSNVSIGLRNAILVGISKSRYSINNFPSKMLEMF